MSAAAGRRAPGRAARRPRRLAALVRYGEFAWLGTFETRIEGLAVGDAIVVRTERGREWGEVVAPPEPAGGAPTDERAGQVLRRASALDRRARERITLEEIPEDYAFFTDALAALAIPARLVAIERLLGGERLVFYIEPARPEDLEDQPWGALVERMGERYGELRVEVREVGETVREKAVGCGSGGGCERCGGAKEEPAGAAMPPPPVISSAPPRRLPMMDG